MPDVLQASSDWLEDQRDEKRTIVVVYDRDGDQVSIDATVGETIFEIDNGFGVLERWEARDFLVFAKDIGLTPGEVLPRRGDRILETQGSKTFTYEVMSPSGQPLFRNSDPFRKTLRIHTKLVKVV